MGLSEQIKRQILTQLKPKLEMIQKIAEEELRNAIQKYVYDAYDPVEYDRTYQLLESVTSTEVEFDGKTVTFSVVLDREKMKHFSVVDGEPTLVSPLIQYGHKQSGYTEVDYFRVYPGKHMLEKAVKEIQEDLNKAAIDATVKVLNYKKYR